MQLQQAIKEAKDKSKKRKFTQTLELIINFQNLDFNKVQNRLNLEIPLPKGLGKNPQIAVIADDDLLAEAKKTADHVITKDQLQKLAKNKKQAKKTAQKYHSFIAQASLMPEVGKTLGQALGPRGKMPKPVPGNAKLTPLIERMKRTIRIKNKGKYLPTIQAPIGTEEMSDTDLETNASTVLSAVREKLPNKEGNIKNVYIKTSMGPSISVKS